MFFVLSNRFVFYLPAPGDYSRLCLLSLDVGVALPAHNIKFIVVGRLSLSNNNTNRWGHLLIDRGTVS